MLIFRFVAVVVLGASAVAEPHAFLRENARDARVTVTASGLQYTVLAAAHLNARGPPSRVDRVELRYVSKLLDGHVVDRSTTAIAHTPGELMPGLNEVLQLMREGDHWRVWLPPELGHGDVEWRTVPKRSVLEFDIEIVRLLPTAEEEAAAHAATSDWEKVLRMRIVKGAPVELRHVFMICAFLVLAGCALECASCCRHGAKLKAA
jgi:hypothetical protein